eukprot:5319642-Pyramimonas_sp.AAC.2
MELGSVRTTWCITTWCSLYIPEGIPKNTLSNRLGMSLSSQPPAEVWIVQAVNSKTDWMGNTSRATSVM